MNEIASLIVVVFMINFIKDILRKKFNANCQFKITRKSLTLSMKFDF